MTDIQQYLKSNQIEFTLHEHPAVFTTDEAAQLKQQVPGIAGKNLFLRNKSKNRYFLVVMPASERADLKQIGEIVGEKKLSFASPEDLEAKLGVTPGAVSPFGLLNDREGKVEVYIHQAMLDAEVVNFHPNRNTASLELSKEMFGEYLSTIGHEIHKFRSNE